MAHDEVIQEIEEDIRQEQFLKFWKKYGKHIIAIVIAIISGTATFTMWSSYNQKYTEQLALEFTTAHLLADEKKESEAIDLFEKISNSRSSIYRTFARLYKTKLSFDPTLKSMQYDEIIKDPSADNDLKDLAFLFQTYIVIQNSNDTKELELRIKKIDEIAKTSPWKLLLLEMKGTILFSFKDFNNAALIFSEIAKDPLCPRSLATRSSVMSKLCVSKTKEQKK